MAQGKEWQRSPDGFRLQFGGMNTMLPPDQLPETKYPYAQNVRRYKDRKVTGRATQGAAVLSLGSPVHSTRRLNDTTPAGPLSGFILISGAGGSLFAGATLVDGGMSGKPVSLVPFRPNQSVQPWMYVADANKMLKVRSDGTTYKMGVKEPQTAPSVVTNVAATIISFIGNVTVYYWGDSPHSGPVGQYIWRNGNDTGSSGPTRSTADAEAAGHVTTGTSLLFDESHVSPAGTPVQPMQWTLLDDTGASLGTKSLFEPAFESEGYADFNFVAQCSLYVPAPGAYTFQAAYKDRIMWGIGNGQNGEVPTWPTKGTERGTTNQSMTVIGGYPLLPAPASNDGGGYTGTSSVVVTFPAAGIYPFELNYDYWYHSNRHCTVKVNGVDIPPITGDVFTNSQYRYTYRSSATGATSNPSPASNAITLPVSSTDITPVPSTDPQVDKVDWYRMDSGLLDWTYVGTSPNAPTAFHDALLDSAVSRNPLLQFDNFEPFPSIDLPKKGTVNVAGGAVDGTMQVTWVSGDQFNVRWLPGTIIIIGTVAYTFYNRPTSTTQLTVQLTGDLPTTLTGLTYEIAEPDLAAQPMPSMWGPTDNVNFMFACGDPLRPGVLYWTKGNNPDSAPDTNQEDVTSPSEPLMNGCIVSGIGMLFSTERAWLIYPNFFNALATVSGTVGSTWTLQESIATRGLYVRRGICTDGGGNVFFRAKDGIYISPGGVGAQSITDGDLYNLFPHEGFTPQPIGVAGFTIYPPDDTQPDAQELNSANGYVYYDYKDVNGDSRTLVYDIAAKAWCVDVYQYQATTHALEEGPNVNGVLIGSVDGSVRPLVNAGPEIAEVVLLTQCVNAGDARADKRIGDIFMRGYVVGGPVSVTPFSSQFTFAIPGLSSPALGVGVPNQRYILDFTSGLSQEVDDIELVIQWAAGAPTVIDLWQPNWIPLPEGTQDRPTDWTDCGVQGAKFVQGFILEADTFNQPKAIAVQNGDDLSFHTPNESPVIFNGESQKAFTFTPPFIAHTVRLVTTDGVEWRIWGIKWVFVEQPESVVQWQTPGTSHGLLGWQHVRELNIAHISTADLTLTITPDQGLPIVLTVPNSGGIQTKTKVTVPANKAKIYSYQITSSAPFRVFEPDIEVKVGQWGRTGDYQILRPFGGPSQASAVV